jgi:heme oxygenase
VPLASDPILRYVIGSTVKVEQLVGEEDKQLHQLTLSRTATRYGIEGVIEGTDLGNSAYLSVVPAAQFESGKGTRYFAGLDRVSAPI